MNQIQVQNMLNRFVQTCSSTYLYGSGRIYSALCNVLSLVDYYKFLQELQYQTFLDIVVRNWKMSNGQRNTCQYHFKSIVASSCLNRSKNQCATEYTGIFCLLFRISASFCLLSSRFTSLLKGNYRFIRKSLIRFRYKLKNMGSVVHQRKLDQFKRRNVSRRDDYVRIRVIISLVRK